MFGKTLEKKTKNKNSLLWEVAKGIKSLLQKLVSKDNKSSLISSFPHINYILSNPIKVINVEGMTELENKYFSATN